MDDAARFSIVEKLVGLNREDWKYADLYVRQAEAAMAPLCTREQFRALRGQRARMKQLISELERTIQRGDWPATEKLAAEGAELWGRVERDSRLLALAEKTGCASTTTLALTGAVAQPARVLE